VSAVAPIRFAYADPPYPGKARKYYGDHPDYAGEVDHAELIARLEADFPDGWALSTGAAALQQVLALMPPPRPRGAAGGGVRFQFRVLAWCKPLAQPGSDRGPAPAALYGWEPVIIRGGRRAAPGPRPRDWLVTTPELFTYRPRPKGHVTGTKPPEFCHWLFACAGLRAGDQFVDLFTGSGAVAKEWDLFERQPSLFAPDPADVPAAEVLGV
jgi:hypothetical protein